MSSKPKKAGLLFGNLDHQSGGYVVVAVTAANPDQFRSIKFLLLAAGVQLGDSTVRTYLAGDKKAELQAEVFLPRQMGENDLLGLLGSAQERLDIRCEVYRKLLPPEATPKPTPLTVVTPAPAFPHSSLRPGFSAQSLKSTEAFLSKVTPHLVDLERQPARVNLKELAQLSGAIDMLPDHPRVLAIKTQWQNLIQWIVKNWETFPRTCANELKALSKRLVVIVSKEQSRVA